MKPGRWQRKHCHEAAPATHIPPWLDWLWYLLFLPYVVVVCLYLYVFMPAFALVMYPMQHWPVEGKTLPRRIGAYVGEMVEEHKPRWW